MHCLCVLVLVSYVLSTRLMLATTAAVAATTVCSTSTSTTLRMATTTRRGLSSLKASSLCRENQYCNLSIRYKHRQCIPHPLVKISAMKNGASRFNLEYSVKTKNKQPRIRTYHRISERIRKTTRMLNA